MSEQVEEFKIICKLCGHWIKVDKASMEKYEANPDDYKCELCYQNPKGPFGLRQLVACANCNQTFLSTSSCECPIPQSSIKMWMDPKGVWIKKSRHKDDNPSYDQATMRKFNSKVRNKRLEAEERSINIEKQLIETNKLLRKLLKGDKDV